MTLTQKKSDKNLFPMVAASLLACALTGVAMMVSANTQANRQTSSHSDVQIPGLAALQAKLQADQLKQNALTVLRQMPDYYATRSSALTKQFAATGELVNVNTFLLANRINNDSQLAELQMQPFFGDVAIQQFTQPVIDSTIEADAKTSANFVGVGFPHIETGNRAQSAQYKPYKQLMSISHDAHGGMVANVRCMGLSAESVANRAEKYSAKIFELAIKHRVSANLVKAVVAKESCFDPTARSKVGAIGLMQLMPETAQWLNVSKPENANQNLSAGVRYLAQLRKRFGSNELALAAYNAGPGNVERYNGIPPFAETQNYVRDVLYFYRGYVATTRFVNAVNDFE